MWSSVAAHLVPGFIDYRRFQGKAVVVPLVVTVEMHRYVKAPALQHEVAIVPSYNLDATLSQVMDLVVGQAIEAVPQQFGHDQRHSSEDCPEPDQTR